MTARRSAEFLVLLAAFMALTALFFWQILPHLRSALIGPPEDNLQDFWNSWYAVQKHPDGFFFTRLIRAPEGVSLLYHSFAYPQIFAVWSLSKIFGTSLQSLVLLQNLTTLASFPLAAVGAFYLCRHLSGSTLGAVAGGFIFAFNPWHVTQAMHHAHVAGIAFLPFFALCYLLAMERSSMRWLAGAIAFYALSALSCWYYFFYCFYFIAFHLLYLRLHEHRWPRGWRLAAPALCLGGAALLLSPLILPMMLSGLHDRVYQIGSNIFVADLLGYTAFPPTHLLSGLGAGLYDSFTGNPWEDTVYLGLVNLALLGWGFWRAQAGERRILWYALGGMIFFIVLASGDALHWHGHISSIPMPDVALARLPFFANVRTPSRALVFVYLFLGVGASATIASAPKYKRSAITVTGLTLALGLMLIDFFPAHLQTTAMACAPELAVLARDPDRAAGVLDLPSGYRDKDFYMAQQACHGRPIAQGVIARLSTVSLADHLEVRDLAAQRRQLRAAGMGYILLHHRQGDLFVWDTKTDGNQAQYQKSYAIVSDDADMTILRID